MSRNPNKKICAKANCRSYAMRGRDLCRSHLDPILGSRGAGARKRNLNSLKHGAFSRFNPGDLKELSQQMVDDPHHYHDHMLNYLEQAGRPTDDPLNSLIIHRALIENLIPLVAENRFTIEAEDLIQRFKPQQQPSAQVLIWQGFVNLPPFERLLQFRKMRNDLFAKWEARGQVASFDDI